MSRRVVVIGGGVAGCAVAAQLAEVPGVDTTVLERGARGALPGSTGHAPGYVGLLDEARHLTELARESVLRADDAPAVQALRSDRFDASTEAEVDLASLRLYRDVCATVDTA